VKPVKKCISDASLLQVRLKKVIGQLNGIQKMLEEDVPCEDVLLQFTAVNGALHKISFMILEGHLRHCVREGIESGNADETIESFAESLENFAKMA
jgi:DNA-binding FrmR family transcriptional regulator